MKQNNYREQYGLHPLSNSEIESIKSSNSEGSFQNNSRPIQKENQKFQQRQQKKQLDRSDSIIYESEDEKEAQIQPLVVVTLEVGSVEERISVYQGQDVHQLAVEFCQKHNLNQQGVQYLHGKISEQVSKCLAANNNKQIQNHAVQKENIELNDTFNSDVDEIQDLDDETQIQMHSPPKPIPMTQQPVRHQIQYNQFFTHETPKWGLLSMSSAKDGKMRHDAAKHNQGKINKYLLNNIETTEATNNTNSSTYQESPSQNTTDFYLMQKDQKYTNIKQSLAKHILFSSAENDDDNNEGVKDVSSYVKNTHIQTFNEQQNFNFNDHIGLKPKMNNSQKNQNLKLKKLSSNDIIIKQKSKDKFANKSKNHNLKTSANNKKQKNISVTPRPSSIIKQQKISNFNNQIIPSPISKTNNNTYLISNQVGFINKSHNSIIHCRTPSPLLKRKLQPSKHKLQLSNNNNKNNKNINMNTEESYSKQQQQNVKNNNNYKQAKKFTPIDKGKQKGSKSACNTPRPTPANNIKNSVKKYRNAHDQQELKQQQSNIDYQSQNCINQQMQYQTQIKMQMPAEFQQFLTLIFNQMDNDGDGHIDNEHIDIGTLEDGLFRLLQPLLEHIDLQHSAFTLHGFLRLLRKDSELHDSLYKYFIRKHHTEDKQIKENKNINDMSRFSFGAGQFNSMFNNNNKKPDLNLYPNQIQNSSNRCTQSPLIRRHAQIVNKKN